MTISTSRLLWVFGLMMVPALHAAELKPETLSAWDQYVKSADAAMQARLQPGRAFLWMDESPERRRLASAGEILVSSMGEAGPDKVPAGLIHHWIGAAFFPNTKLDDVLGVVRDYGHYKEYYNPSVIDARVIEQTPGEDVFSMMLMNKALFLKTALEGEYQSTYAQVGRHRWYGVATTVRIQEIEGYGEAGQHKLPADEGSGYIWRMHSITRFEEAGGGVFVEMETMALSRDIPAAVRWMVNPIVRRVARGAMITSIRQTQDAVSSASRMASAGHVATVPVASAGFLQTGYRH